MKSKEGQPTNWWSELHVKYEKNGYVSFRLGKMEYLMSYSSFDKMYWLIKKQHNDNSKKAKTAK